MTSPVGRAGSQSTPVTPPSISLTRGQVLFRSRTEPPSLLPCNSSAKNREATPLPLLFFPTIVATGGKQDAPGPSACGYNDDCVCIRVSGGLRLFDVVVACRERTLSCIELVRREQGLTGSWNARGLTRGSSRYSSHPSSRFFPALPISFSIFLHSYPCVMRHERAPQRAPQASAAV